MVGPMTLHARPIGQRAARDWIASTHRHLGPPRGDVFRVAIWKSETLVGVAIAARPSARMIDDGRTLEISRVATTGERDACSFAYGRLRRAGIALGWVRFITYTLADEPGSSLRGAGWIHAGWTDGGEWSRPSRERRAAIQSGVKSRWVYPRSEWEDELKRWGR